jgi:transposase
MNKRRNFSAKFKTKVVLEALKEQQTLSELAQKHKLHLNQISKWKQEFLASAESVFEKGKAKKQTGGQQKEEKLYKIIGQQKVEIDFLKTALL